MSAATQTTRPGNTVGLELNELKKKYKIKHGRVLAAVRCIALRQWVALQFAGNTVLLPTVNAVK